MDAFSNITVGGGYGMPGSAVVAQPVTDVASALSVAQVGNTGIGAPGEVMTVELRLLSSSLPVQDTVQGAAMATPSPQPFLPVITPPVVRPVQRRQERPLAAVQPAGEAPQPQRRPTVEVVSGDTLSGIAARHGMTWQRLYEANRDVVGDNPNLIRPGQVLTIP